MDAEKLFGQAAERAESVSLYICDKCSDTGWVRAGADHEDPSDYGYGPDRPCDCDSGIAVFFKAREISEFEEVL